MKVAAHSSVGGDCLLRARRGYGSGTSSIWAAIVLKVASPAD
jgi:hypothetical protein